MSMSPDAEPLYGLPDEIMVTADGPARIVTLNRPNHLNEVMPADKASVAAPTRRGKPPKLTKKEIVDAALDIIRTEGLDALSHAGAVAPT
jgi:hypothetical protein